MSLTIASILAESAVRHADRTAVVLGDLRLTYAQLWGARPAVRRGAARQGRRPGRQGGAAAAQHAALPAGLLRDARARRGRGAGARAAQGRGDPVRPARTPARRRWSAPRRCSARAPRAPSSPASRCSRSWTAATRRSSASTPLPLSATPIDGAGAARARGHRGDPLHQRHDRHAQGRRDHPPQRDDERRSRRRRTRSTSRKDDVVLGCLPLFHTFGQTCCMNTAFCVGATRRPAAALRRRAGARAAREGEVHDLHGRADDVRRAARGGQDLRAPADAEVGAVRRRGPAGAGARAVRRGRSAPRSSRATA